MKDELVTYNTAVLAKEKGFDEQCNKLYCANRGHGNKTIELCGISSANNSAYKNIRPTWAVAPTQSLLQRWLREKHTLILEVTFESLGSDEWAYSYTVHYLPEDKKQAKRRVPEMVRHTSFLASGATYTGAWDTYEQALEAGLQHALKLLR